MRILIASMGSTAAQNLVWALRRPDPRKWFVIGADAQKYHGGFGLGDVDVQLPAGNDPRYVKELLRTTNRNSVDLIVPVMEPELESVSANFDLLHESGSTVIVSPHEAIEICASKQKLAERLESLDIDTPVVLEPGKVRSFPCSRDRSAAREAKEPWLSETVRNWINSPAHRILSSLRNTWRGPNSASTVSPPDMAA